MLVLSRRTNERIKLGDSITVTVVRVAGDKVRLGIEAPRDLVVLREELERRPAVMSTRVTSTNARPATAGAASA